MQDVGFIGLGVMGAPMAGHLARRGYGVRVHTRTVAKAEAWTARHEGDVAATAADAARGADVVFACVGNDDDVRAVTVGSDGAFNAMEPGAVFVDHTTTSATLARELASAATARGIGFVDAPVSGGQSGAESGQLTVMAGGSLVHFERARPMIESYARFVRLLGPSGAGQLAKMVNQVCIAGLIEALAEGVHFAQHVGIDAAAVFEVLARGAAQSWHMEHRTDTMLNDQYDFGFAVDWMRKDLGIALAEAERHGLTLPVTELVDRFYADVQQLGGGRWDTSSLLRRLQQFASARR